MSSEPNTREVMRSAGELGLRFYKSEHDRLTAREKLALAEEERAACVQRAEKLSEARRNALVNDGILSDDEQRRDRAEVEQDLQDYDVLIAELRQQVAAEDAAAAAEAEQVAAAAEAERQTERKQVRTKAAAKLDKALAAAEAAYTTWRDEQSDLPVTLRNRRLFYLQAALAKLAPELALALGVKRPPHSHQRPLAEVQS